MLNHAGILAGIFFVIFTALCLPISAQDKSTRDRRVQDAEAVEEDDEVIRIDTELIEVPVTIVDGGGRPILSLKRNDFELLEDGKKHEIAEFSTTSAPFEIALLLDTSGSTRSDIQLIRRSAQQFINALRPGDRVAIIAFKGDVVDGQSLAVPDVLVELTGDRQSLSAALENVGTSNGTPYYDALIKVAEQIFKEPPSKEFRGRRALVALTDGVDSTSISDFREAKELLEEAGVAGYFVKVDTRPFFEENLLGDCHTAIRFSQAQIKRYYAGFGPNANIERTSDFCQLGDFERLAISKQLYQIADNEMNEIAQSSSGKVFPVSSLNDARLAFKKVAEEIGTRYSLGYYSTNKSRDGKYRKIKVEVKGLPTGAEVRAREGYTARSN